MKNINQNICYFGNIKIFFKSKICALIPMITVHKLIVCFLWIIIIIIVFVAILTQYLLGVGIFFMFFFQKIRLLSLIVVIHFIYVKLLTLIVIFSLLSIFFNLVKNIVQFFYMRCIRFLTQLNQQYYNIIK